LCSSGIVERHLADVSAWATDTLLADGRRVIDQEWVQIKLAEVHAKLEFLKLANWKIAWEATQGQPLQPAEASAIKVFGTEFYLQAARQLLEVLGSVAVLRRDSPGVAIRGRIEHMVRSMHILTFGGGVNEMQRDLISLFGLGMPSISR
jgi:alkylation response protein AidB-like acyl-CoA dehydrogenase